MLRVWTRSGSALSRAVAPGSLQRQIDVSIAPLILGAGERLFEGLDRSALELKQIRAVDAPSVTHIKYDTT
jgi:dihydrofolate reductase